MYVYSDGGHLFLSLEQIPQGFQAGFWWIFIQDSLEMKNIKEKNFTIAKKVGLKENRHLENGLYFNEYITLYTFVQ